MMFAHAASTSTRSGRRVAGRRSVSNAGGCSRPSDTASRKRRAYRPSSRIGRSFRSICGGFTPRAPRAPRGGRRSTRPIWNERTATAAALRPSSAASFRCVAGLIGPSRAAARSVASSACDQHRPPMRIPFPPPAAARQRRPRAPMRTTVRASRPGQRKRRAGRLSWPWRSSPGQFASTGASAAPSCRRNRGFLNAMSPRSGFRRRVAVCAEHGHFFYYRKK
jgi:hypothetical protein